MPNPWAGKTNQIAYWTTQNPDFPLGTWEFYEPLYGWTVYNNADGKTYRFQKNDCNVDAWVEFGTSESGGTVTNSGTLTNHAIMLGNGGVNITPLGSVGTSTTVLHGSASGNPSFSGVVEADLSLTDITTANSSTSKHGLAPKLDGNSGHFLDGTGAWTSPTGSGVTLKTNGSNNTSQSILNLISGTNATVTADGSGGVTIAASDTVVALEVNGTPNGDQTLLNLIEGTGITVTDGGGGAITIAATGGGGGLTVETNGTPNGSQSLLNLINGTNVTLVDDGSGNVTINGPAITTFETNGSPNVTQSLLNLVAGLNMLIVDDGSGNITFTPPAPCTFETGGSPNVSQTLLNLVAGLNMLVVDDGSGNITFTPPPPITLQTNNVSNVNQVLQNILNGTGMTITDDGSGNITFAAYTGDQTQNLVFVAPDGTNGPPTFRALVNADLPTGLGHFVSPPADAASAGNPGDYATDGTFAYLCLSTGNWFRWSVATW